MRGQSRSTRKKTKGTISSPQLSRTHKPEHLSLEEWQRALRRQYGRAQKFIWRNLGNEPVFSDYVVTNPITKNSYQVIIRGTRSGDNHCTCPDFSVNTLGTCKHIEFVLGRLERKAGKRALAAAYVPPFSEIFLRYGAKREVVFSLGAECPIELKKLLPDLFDKNGVLLEGAYQHFHRFLSQAAATGHEIRCRDDAMAFVAEKRDHENRRRQLEKIFPRGADSPYFRNLLKTDLFPYQRQGALFAASAARCLIGDEMGLGKTIQAIAAAEILAREFGIERVLVICPTSLKYQWKQEIERFANRTVAIVEGPAPTRKQALTSEAFFKIINYDIVYRELDLIRQWSPDLIILDEAQRIKNWKTRTAQSVKRLSSQFALVLTGTPLENRLEELYSIIEFIDRFRLGPMFQFLHRHQMQDDGGKIVGYRNLDQISQTLAPILIRRTKEQVALQLPKRVENQYFVPMTKQQMSYHEENREIVARIVAKWRKYKYLSEADQRRLTCALQNMRMSCNSTFLLDSETDFGHKADEIALLLEEAFENPEMKVVIFSQWLRMHEVIIRRLADRGWNYVHFHGGVPSRERGALVKRFVEDEQCRIFLSTDAGGTGLNLQQARMVINVDLPWNPAVLEQRIGRVHRLGQQQPVQAVSFIAQGTIEQGMLDLLSFKKSMFAGVLDGGPGEVFLSGSRLSRFMDTVEKATTSIPLSMPDESPADITEAKDESPLPEKIEVEIPAMVPAMTPPWMEVLNSGLKLLQNLGLSMAPNADSAKPTKSLIHHDEATGETYVRIPKLNADAINKVSNGLRLLAEAFSDLTPPY